MMKQQPSDTTKKPSRLCRFLLLLVAGKVCLLGVLLFDPAAYLDSFAVSSSDVVAVWEKNATRSGTAAPVAEAEQSSGQKNEPAAGQTIPASGLAVISTAQLEAGPAPAMQLPKVRRAPGVAFAAAPASASRQETQPGALSLEALARKQEELTRKEQDLKNLQAELDDRFAQMQELEMRLQIMLRDAEEMKDSRYRHLVDVLSNMKARQAADVLATLDEKIAVRVLAGMRGRQAGEILSFADPVKAARLTEQLARIQMPLE